MSRSAEWLQPIVLVTTLVALGCAPAAPPSAQTSTPPSRTAAAPKTLTIALQGEPKAIMTMLGGDVGGSPAGLSEHAFHQHLSTYNERGEVIPMLAAELPSQANGTWTLRPDGTMQTTYKLRSGVTWHDGAPFTARDVVFGWNVARDKELPVVLDATLPITHIETPDDLTVVMEWSSPHPNADIITDWTVGPLPTHLLEATYQTDKELFQRLPYWHREFVGLGPWRLSRWEPGAFIEGEAFDGHALGRPKIDRIRIIFTPDPNTALANLLSSAADIAADDTTRYQQTSILEREWAGNQGGTVLKSFDQHRRAELQTHPERANPIALRDARVRRALAYAIDRDALNDGLIDGSGRIANTLIAPGLDYFEAANSTVTKYPFDLRQTEQLLAQVDYTKGPDGIYRHPTAGRFALEVKTLEGGQNEAEMAILADQYRRAGFDVSEGIVPAAQIQSGQVRASFSSMQTTSGGTIDILSSKNTARPENRWQGHNRGSWTNPEFDRLITAFESTLDRAERGGYIARAAKLYSDEVPSIPLYYNVRVVPHVAALKGPVAMAPPLWNVHQWELP